MGCDTPTIPRAFWGTFEWFFRSEVSGSILLLACTVIALVLANSPLAGVYDQVLHTKAGVSLGDASLKLTLHHWVNDGLMVIFFFVVGLEISCLAGIGFTMSLFVTGLALPSESMLANAKVGILAASLLSGIIGSVILSLTLPRKERTQ